MNPLAISDADVERLLRGQAPTGPGLSRLGSVIEELQAFRSRGLGAEVRSRHVAAAAEAARAATPPPAVARSARRVRRWRFMPRLGTAGAAFVLVLAMTGVAVASDSSSPGDPLHGLDVFLESLGIGDGGDGERITEARDLSAKGMTVEALNHLTSTLSDAEESGAKEALKTASERIKEQQTGSEQSQEVRERVSEMLQWMATTDAQGRDFGQEVAERARSLGGDDTGVTPGDTEAEPVGKENAATPGKGKGEGTGKGPKPPGKPGK